MSARAEFLERPDALCICGHAFGCHGGHPCLETSSDNAPCRDCHYRSPVEPAGEDPVPCLPGGG